MPSPNERLGAIQEANREQYIARVRILDNNPGIEGHVRHTTEVDELGVRVRTSLNRILMAKYFDPFDPNQDREYFVRWPKPTEINA